MEDRMRLQGGGMGPRSTAMRPWIVYVRVFCLLDNTVETLILALSRLAKRKPIRDDLHPVQSTEVP